ncbi:hypothetical protein C8Q80DRAFT_155918 [Daedaleopsis nitida]|nr:hypothetical protein C8Q80DRAFT_155918 [Daedaleopsis nitida]
MIFRHNECFLLNPGVCRVLRPFMTGYSRTVFIVPEYTTPIPSPLFGPCTLCKHLLLTTHADYRSDKTSDAPIADLHVNRGIPNDFEHILRIQPPQCFFDSDVDNFFFSWWMASISILNDSYRSGVCPVREYPTVVVTSAWRPYSALARSDGAEGLKFGTMKVMTFCVVPGNDGREYQTACVEVRSDTVDSRMTWICRVSMSLKPIDCFA